MMKFDTVHSFWNFSHAVRGCHNSMLLLKVEQKRRHMSTVDQCALTHHNSRVRVTKDL